MSLRLLTASALFGLAANACSSDVCKVLLSKNLNGEGHESYYARTDSSTYHLDFTAYGISSVKIIGGSKCKLTLYDQSHHRGNSIVLRMKDEHYLNLDTVYVEDFESLRLMKTWNNRMRSFKLEMEGRRRQERANFDLEVHDPLCEWVLQDGIDSDWAMFSPEERTQEVENLVEECGEHFTDDANRMQCQFYVYAIAEVFDDHELLETMKFDPKEETVETEYMRCGMITNKLHDLIEQGQVPGIKVVKSEDGEDHFELTEASEFETTALQSVEDKAALQSLLSVGTMIAVTIGHTLVKVCRDFDADGHWLL